MTYRLTVDTQRTGLPGACVRRWVWPAWASDDEHAVLGRTLPIEPVQGLEGQAYTL